MMTEDETSDTSRRIARALTAYLVTHDGSKADPYIARHLSEYARHGHSLSDLLAPDSAQANWPTLAALNPENLLQDLDLTRDELGIDAQAVADAYREASHRLIRYGYSERLAELEMTANRISPHLRPLRPGVPLPWRLLWASWSTTPPSRQLGHPHDVRAIIASPESARHVLTYTDRQFSLWDVSRGSELCRESGVEIACGDVSRTTAGALFALAERSTRVHLVAAPDGTIRTLELGTQAIGDILIGPGSRSSRITLYTTAKESSVVTEWAEDGSLIREIDLRDAAGPAYLRLTQTFSRHFDIILNQCGDRAFAIVTNDDSATVIDLMKEALVCYHVTSVSARKPQTSLHGTSEDLRIFLLHKDPPSLDVLSLTAAYRYRRTLTFTPDPPADAGFPRGVSCGVTDGFPWLAVGYDGGDIRVWNAATGSALYEFQGPRASPNVLTLDEAGRRLLTANDRQLMVWDRDSVGSATNRPAATPHARPVYGLAVSSGHLFSCSEDGVLAAWQADSGQLLRHRKLDVFGGACVTIESSGPQVLMPSASGVLVLDGAGLETVGILPAEGLSSYAICLCRLPGSGPVVVGATDHSLLAWEVPGGRALPALPTDSSTVYALESVSERGHIAMGTGDGLLIASLIDRTCRASEAVGRNMVLSILGTPRAAELGGDLVVGTYGGTLHRLGLDGEVRWSRRLGTSAIKSLAWVRDETGALRIVTGDYGGELHLIDPSGDSSNDRTIFLDPIVGAISGTAAESRIYCGSDRALLCLDLAGQHPATGR
ncbi:hypothetical protein DMB66_57440 [Actinoplanes sp. ATCC 53533]|uniref:WD40 repeat domain-containing protein n=1 Tax=Actinoplanes sp. ATCC 53533 TaxID=1288362 RepID=UPI000F799499|nr:WD40 repeat domain-containing protein [Actinoplanes sp. ATCC 53533]RSM40144.1 hypothetical protein DMB66_57440 [Actinoplanes sp. ATCC 53533]